MLDVILWPVKSPGHHVSANIGHTPLNTAIFPRTLILHHQCATNKHQPSEGVKEHE